MAGPEELDRLTKADPEFNQMIVTRDQVHKQIRLIKNDLLARKGVMDAEIEKLRNDYDAYAKSQNKSIEKLQTVIESNRNVLLTELEQATAQLETKKIENEGYLKTLADLKKRLKEPKNSTQEKQKWEERVLLFSEKIRPLSEEIQELQLKVRSTKQKINFLK